MSLSTDVDVPALLFERVWRELGSDAVTYNAGSVSSGSGSEPFIYARDMVKFITRCEGVIRDLSVGFPVFNGKLRFPMLGQIYMDVLDSFAKETPYYKVYKKAFSEMFTRLVGKGFDEVIGSVFEGVDGFPKEFIDQLQLQVKPMPASTTKEKEREQSRLWERESPARVHLFQNTVKSPADSPHRMDRKYKSLELQVQTMKKEVDDKDQLIKEREQMVAQLNTSLQIYKEKYQTLSQEYERSLQRKPKPQIHVKQDAFIQELKLKLQEQNKMIRELRDIISNKPLSTTILSSQKKSDTNASTSSGIITKFALVMATLWLVWFIRFPILSPNEEVDGLALSWWERNNFISRLVWAFKDTISSTSPPTHAESDAYNRVFNM
ncbi:hypothetical protein RNJ44_01761 [Nakaseomyces bracarensis]|uniref:Monopolar spindle protein 2 n=1 Tax=Nakaseomyces bracarensis TaxID=273131 RepID=A0ABR4NNT1_9SACH